MTEKIIYRHCETRLEGVSGNPQDGLTRMVCPECGDDMHIKVVDWPNPDWPYDN